MTSTHQLGAARPRSELVGGSISQRHGRAAARGALLLACLLWAAPASAQLSAPNARITVAAVIAAHPEINSCDEDARGAIVDYAAQRLNKHLPAPAWGRKSRGKPVDGRAVNPNTDGLTFLRPDGRFEIYDVISGSAPCGATWDGFGPFEQGANGWWAPPQLGPEPGTVDPPPPPPPPDDSRLRALEQRVEELAARLTQADQRLSARIDAVVPFDLGAVQAAIAAALRNYRAVGSTSRAFGHSHQLNVTLEPIR